MLRDMTDPAGGFYSAEDADSIPPGLEDTPTRARRKGRSTSGAMRRSRALVGGDIDVARRTFGLEEAGNAPHDPHGEFTGRNLLYIAESPHDVAMRTGRTEADVQAAIRPHPGRRCSARAPAVIVRISTTRCSRPGTA